jgi:hypothetical protein
LSQGFGSGFHTESVENTSTESIIFKCPQTASRVVDLADRDGLIILQVPEQFQRWRGAARRVVVRVKVVFLGVVARKFRANAAIAPTKAPKMANSTFWCVYENAIPAMLIVRRGPAAKASFVAKSDRMKLGTIIAAMNKVITTSISS